MAYGACLTIVPTQSAVYLLFNLDGPIACDVRSTDSFVLGSRQHGLLTTVTGAVQVRGLANRPTSLVIIQIDSDWLAGQVTTGWDSGRVDRQSLTLTPRMLTVVYELIDGYIPSAFRSIYLNGKIMELLALQLDQQQIVIPAVSDLMRAKMHQVRELLMANLATPPSIRELARQVGTNEFSLKQSFKILYNTTVFSYLQQVRMEKARLMLTESNTQIVEVARLLGYKHATHFTVAFKKYFGFPPNKISGYSFPVTSPC